MRRAFLLLPLLVLAGCPSADGTATDAGPADLGRILDAAAAEAGAPDAPAADAPAADADPLDAAAADAPAPDAPAADADPLDAAAPDADPLDAAGDAAVGCNYIDVDVSVVLCPGGYDYVRHFTDPAQPAACPDYWALNGQQAASEAAVISLAGCSGACVYRPSTSVSFIDHCGRRNGYIRFTASGCPDILEFSSGFYPTQAAWEAATPCGG